MIFAGLTALIGALTYFHLRKADKRKTTFEALNNQIWDADYIVARKLFTGELADELRILNQKDIKELQDPKNENNKIKIPEGTNAKFEIYTTKADVLKMIINSNELMATGVRLKTLDEKFLYLQLRGQFIKDWNTLCEYIRYVRRTSNNDFIGIEFETLAQKWKSRPMRRLTLAQKFIHRWPQPND